MFYVKVFCPCFFMILLGMMSLVNFFLNGKNVFSLFFCMEMFSQISV